MNQNETDTSPTQLWASLPIDSAQQANLAALGFAGMTPVQAATLPISLAGGDVIAQAKTGSGKTAAFAIPLLQKLNIASLKVQALVLCPTRELADQVCAEIRRLARAYENVKVLPLCGGVALRGQTASLENGAHIVVGTPGRVLDHLQRENLSFDALNTLVLDEADRMLDMGFADDIQAIAKQSPASRQTLLFSATYPDTIAALSARLMRQAQMVKVDTTHDTHAIDEWFFEVEPDTRLDAVTRLLSHYQPASTVAFCNTRVQCNDLVQILRAHGFSALTLHGDLDQRDRDQVLIQFANQSCSVLVATDVAARGLDIAELAAVINVDTTPDPQVYTHRIGRTGRAGATGLALSLVTMSEMSRVARIEEANNRPSRWAKLSELSSKGGALKAPMRTLQIAGGRKEKIRAGDILGALTGEAGFDKAQIGKISLGEFSSYVAVSADIATPAMAALNAGRIKGKRVKVRLLDN
jgi:ATP-independent RNA helicase DbpA